jgi:hypothetical protein
MTRGSAQPLYSRRVSSSTVSAGIPVPVDSHLGFGLAMPPNARATRCFCRRAERAEPGRVLDWFRAGSRRSAVTRLAEAGFEVPEIATITGHSLKG